MDTITEVSPKRSWVNVSARLVVSLIGVALALLILIWLYSEAERYQDFRNGLSEYEGVRIGAPMTEVRYALGDPKWVVGEYVGKTEPLREFRLEYDVDATGGPNVMPKGKTVEQMNGWVWQNGSKRITVDFDPQSKKVMDVSCFASGANAGTHLCSTIGSLAAGDTEEQMVEKLGKPDREQYSQISPTKEAVYGKLGLEVHLEKLVVYFVDKKAPGSVGIWWWMSHGRP